MTNLEVSEPLGKTGAQNTTGSVNIAAGCGSLVLTGFAPRVIDGGLSDDAKRKEKPSRTNGAAAHGGEHAPGEAWQAPNANGSALPKEPIKVEWFSRIEPSDGEWIVENLLPQRGLVAIFGESNAGKSLLALDWSLRLAAGQKVADKDTVRIGVAYVGAEGASGQRKRIKSWREHYGVEGELPFAFIGNALDLREAAREDVGLLIAELNGVKEQFADNGAALGVIVVDTLASVTQGSNESHSEDMGAAVGALQRIAGEIGVVVIVVHHSGHSSVERMRGWSGLPAALDTSIEVSFDKDTDTHLVKVRKQRDAEISEKPIACFRRVRVDLGANGRGKPIKGVVIAYEQAPDAVRPTKKKPRHGDEALLVAIRNATSNHGEAVPAALKGVMNGSVTVVRREHVQAEAERLGLSQFSVTDEGDESARSKARQEFARGIDSLIGQGIIGQYKVNNRQLWIWLCA